MNQTADTKTITLAGTIEFADFWAAGKCHYRLGRFWKVILPLWGAIIFALGTYVLSTGVTEALFLVVGGLVITFSVALLRLLHLRNWRKQPSLAEPFQMSITDTGIESHSVNGNSDVRWTAFTKWKESPEAFLLYLAPNLYVMLCKRLISPASSVEELREMIRRNVRKR
jgi:hypothetical protein